MAEVYDQIEARQFFDFNDDDDDGEAVDIFFDVRETPYHATNLRKFSRMSLSNGDVSHLERALDLGIITGNQQESMNVGPDHVESCNKRPSSFSQSFQSGINRLAMPKKHFSSVENLSEYVPMAEAVRKFQVSTPERFRSRQENKLPCYKMYLTKPKTPHLTTKSRARSVTGVLTHEEKEIMEFQEQQKFKIKAHPLNKKILQGPIKPKVIVEKKAATIPEPFHLTEIQPKVIQSPKVSEFHARPVPKSLRNPCKPKLEKVASTIPKTPSFMKSMKVVPRVSQDQLPKAQVTTSAGPKRTVVVPFSFEIRNQMLRKKKEDSIKQVFEEEKKARIFKANPVPKEILQASKSLSNSINKYNSAHSLNKRGSTENIAPAPFKAKPATVLQKKPFIPARSEKPLSEITYVQLHSDLRAEQREEFDMYLKEREKELAQIKLNEELRTKQLEEEEAKRLRKLAEYKAQPIKKFKELQIKPSGKVTTPISPTIGTRRPSCYE